MRVGQTDFEMQPRCQPLLPLLLQLLLHHRLVSLFGHLPRLEALNTKSQAPRTQNHKPKPLNPQALKSLGVSSESNVSGFGSGLMACAVRV